jgi:hypothetical protein
MRTLSQELRIVQPEAFREDRSAALRQRLQALERDLSALKAEQESLLRLEQELKDLLKCSSRDQIVHAVRNLLNDVVLLKALGNPLGDP